LLAATRTRYTYVGDSPLNRLDATGLYEAPNDSSGTYRPTVTLQMVTSVVDATLSGARASAQNAVKQIAYQSRSGKFVQYYRTSPLTGPARTLGRIDIGYNLVISVF